MAHEEQHRNVTSGGLRAGVFGMSDGLVTNLSLILGFAGAHPSPSVVRLAGLAGLVAGAFSMGTGEWISMSVQRELFERDLEVERRALRDAPEGETEELVQLYVNKGIAPDFARRFANEVMSDPQLALETHAREEFGVDPRSLGSPITASLSSFLAFSIGAFLPLIPWLFAAGTAAITVSIALSAVAAAALGGVLGHLTFRGSWFGAARSLVLAACAAAVTYAIGAAVGTHLH